MAAVCAMAQKLGIMKLLGPECRQRDLAFALIISRVARLGSKLPATSWWNDTTLGEDLGMTDADPGEVYTAMDWLLTRRDDIERQQLARRHITPGGIAMSGLPGNLPVMRFYDLLEHLSRLRRESVAIAGQPMQKITIPTALQRRVFELIKTTVP